MLYDFGLWLLFFSLFYLWCGHWGDYRYWILNWRWFGSNWGNDRSRGLLWLSWFGRNRHCSDYWDLNGLSGCQCFSGDYWDLDRLSNFFLGGVLFFVMLLFDWSFYSLEVVLMLGTLGNWLRVRVVVFVDLGGFGEYKRIAVEGVRPDHVLGEKVHQRLLVSHLAVH
jgi:hypothetical protein